MTLTPSGYRPRLVDGQIDMMLRVAGAVCVEGPRWSGKTWSSLNAANSVMMVADPSNNFQNRRLIALDVNEALRGEAPHLIDEWQEFPEIWDAVRMSVDRSQERGRYILTGSSTPRIKGALHRGTGRIDRIRMRTMSLYEDGTSDGRVSLASLFDGTFKQSLSSENVSLDQLLGAVVRGGWPGNIGLEPDAAFRHNTEYIASSVEDAVATHRMDRMQEGDGGSKQNRRDISRKKVLMTMRSLARNESTLASASKIARDTADLEEEVDLITVNRYLDVLDRLFLIQDQPAFDPNFRSSVRVGKASKRHLADPSLAAAAMGLNTRMLKGDLETFGLLFEALCERDLDVYAGLGGGRMFHYRDHSGNEIDAILEMPDGRWGAFEIKLGTRQVDGAAENLIGIRDMMIEKQAKRPPSVLAVVCGMESSAYRREDGVYVLPITALGP